MILSFFRKIILPISAVVIFTLLGTLSTAFCDVVILNDGSKIEGSIIRMDSGQLELSGKDRAIPRKSK